MYNNTGFIKGTLRFAPKKVSEGVVLLTLRVMNVVTDKDTGERRREPSFPSFTLFGREAYKALANLEEGQRIELEYRLETNTKLVKGEKKFFEDKVVQKITYGEKRPKRSNATPEAASETNEVVPAVLETVDSESTEQVVEAPVVVRKSVFNNLAQ